MDPRRDPLRHLILPAYGTAFVILASATLDLAQAVWPFQPTEPGWRYGTAGFLSGSIVTPSLAALLALAVALHFRHAGVQYLLAAAGVVACLVLMAAGVIFTLDGILLGNRVQPNAQNTLLVAQVKALAKLGLGFILAWLYALSAWRSARSLSQASGKTPESADMLVSSRQAAGRSEASAGS